MREHVRDLSAPLSAPLRRSLPRRLLYDPRGIVALVGVALLALGSLSTIVLTSWMDRTESSVTELANAIAEPKDHLLAAERANDAAQTALAAAIGTTGDGRSTLLTEAVLHAQETSAEWRDYQSSAIGLPGEAELMRKYDDDQAISQKASSDALVPILNSTAPGTLPTTELESYEAVRSDLMALHSLYRDADTDALDALQTETARSKKLLDIGIVVAFGIVLIGMITGLRIAGRAATDRAERSANGRLAAFEARLRRALQLVDQDAGAFVVAGRALREMLPDVDASILTADSSRANLTPLDEPPTCGVSTPAECPALRAGSAVVFSDSEALDACPTLAAHTSRRCSATCVPITVTGRGAAVVHLAGRVGHPPESRGAVDLIARGVGDRVTLLQALATFQLQAERDPLTGLLNRRSLETAVEPLVATGRPYAIAFADLDHFKRINDLHGHEAGDRALRSFSRTLSESLRPNDLTCRWGGEEFLVVLPDCEAATAVDAMERVRTNLALGSIGGHGTVVVAASFGISDSTEAASFDEVVMQADLALRHAKDAGRNRVVHLSQPIPDAATSS